MSKRTLKKTRNLRHHIRGHNKFLTKIHLRSMKPMILLANAHPLYRLSFAKELNDDGLITNKQLDKIRIEEKAA